MHQACCLLSFSRCDVEEEPEDEDALLQQGDQYRKYITRNVKQQKYV